MGSNFSQPCHPAGTNILYQIAWHCYDMDCFTLQKPQALITSVCYYSLITHFGNTTPSPQKQVKQKIYMEDLKFIKCRIWPGLAITCSPPYNSSACFRLCSKILHSWYSRRDVTCNRTKSQTLLVLPDQTQQQPFLAPATLLMQCQCYNVLAKGASGNLRELFCNLLQRLGGFLVQRKEGGEREKPIKFTSRLRKNTPLPIYF